MPFCLSSIYVANVTDEYAENTCKRNLEVIIFFYLLMLGNSVIAQELPPLIYKFDKELKSELNQSMSSLESLIIVDTSLPELSFKCSNSIIAVKQLDCNYNINLILVTIINQY